MENPSQRVAAGVQFLREIGTPSDWPRMIDLETLDIRSQCECVLGQIYGSYAVVEEEQGLRNEQAMDLGFMVRSRSIREYRRLLRAWKKEITRLRRTSGPIEVVREALVA